MGGMTRQLHLNLFIHSRGHHEASWRHPASSPLALTDIRYYQDLARRAEAGLFDSIFLADQLALGDDVDQAARTWLEPVTVLAAVAVTTSRIGMIATASTTYTEPFNLARQFGSLDHISNGRVGWNIVTSWLATAARNFGGTGQVNHAERYGRGDEPSTLPAGSACICPGRIVRHRSPLRRAACRGRVHRAHGEGDRAGILLRPEGAGSGRGPSA